MRKSSQKMKKVLLTICTFPWLGAAFVSHYCDHFLYSRLLILILGHSLCYLSEGLCSHLLDHPELLWARTSVAQSATLFYLDYWKSKSHCCFPLVVYVWTKTWVIMTQKYLIELVVFPLVVEAWTKTWLIMTIVKENVPDKQTITQTATLLI